MKSERVDYGILIQPFDDTLDFDIDNVSEQNFILAKEMKNLLMDLNLNNYYRKQSLLRSKDYDLAKYQKELNEIVIDCIK